MPTDFGIGPENSLDMLQYIFGLKTDEDWSFAINSLLAKYSSNFGNVGYASLAVNLNISQPVLDQLDRLKSDLGVDSRSTLIFIMLLIFNKVDISPFFKKTEEISNVETCENNVLAEVTLIPVTLELKNQVDELGQNDTISIPKSKKKFRLGSEFHIQTISGSIFRIKKIYICKSNVSLIFYLSD